MSDGLDADLSSDGFTEKWPDGITLQVLEADPSDPVDPGTARRDPADPGTTRRDPVDGGPSQAGRAGVTGSEQQSSSTDTQQSGGQRGRPVSREGSRQDSRRDNPHSSSSSSKVSRQNSAHDSRRKRNSSLEENRQNGSKQTRQTASKRQGEELNKAVEDRMPAKVDPMRVSVSDPSDLSRTVVDGGSHGGSHSGSQGCSHGGSHSAGSHGGSHGSSSHCGGSHGGNHGGGSHSASHGGSHCCNHVGSDGGGSHGCSQSGGSHGNGSLGGSHSGSHSGNHSGNHAGSHGCSHGGGSHGVGSHGGNHAGSHSSGSLRGSHGGSHGGYHAGSHAGSHGSGSHSGSHGSSFASDWGEFCRICHEGGDKVPLVTACRCTGSMQHVHNECLIRWILSSFNTHCEICLHRYRIGTTGMRLPHRWKLPVTDGVERYHMLLCMVALIVLAGVISFLIYVSTDQSREARTYRDSPLAPALYAVYAVLGLVCLGLATAELHYTVCPLIERFRLTNMNLLVVPYDPAEGSVDSLDGLSEEYTITV